MQTFRLMMFTAFAGLLIIVAITAAPAAQTIDAPGALSEVEAGKMVLLDIRSPQEWKDTGIAAVAMPLTMHNSGFLTGFQKIVADNPSKKIGVICATGGRTAWMQAELAKLGLSVVDVSEGMLGNKFGPGWIARGLAMKKVQ